MLCVGFMSSLNWDERLLRFPSQNEPKKVILESRFLETRAEDKDMID